MGTTLSGTCLLHRMSARCDVKRPLGKDYSGGRGRVVQLICLCRIKELGQSVQGAGGAVAAKAFSALACEEEPASRPCPGGAVGQALRLGVVLPGLVALAGPGLLECLHAGVVVGHGPLAVGEHRSSSAMRAFTAGGRSMPSASVQQLAARLAVLDDLHQRGPSQASPARADSAGAASGNSSSAPRSKRRARPYFNSLTFESIRSSDS